ncbi:MAG: hypothetical protein LC746_06345 [Acidobacteria bacterium]|nr:hypothetical protein [Acidobacteriota bacterium]
MKTTEDETEEIVGRLSQRIIAECRKRHGFGELFFRTDGLEHEERRAAMRRRFLEANPDIAAEHRAAILKAAVTPGMTRGEATAAWGLLEEDTRGVFGHVTEESQITYAYFTGFSVGRTYALYMRDDVAAGVRETPELIAPHPRETDMKLAERYLDLFCFYDGSDEQLFGTDMDLHRNPPDILAMQMHRTEPVPRFSSDEREMEKLVWRLAGCGVYSDYLEELRRMGTDAERATLAERCEAAVAVKKNYVSWLFTMP